MRGVFLGLFLVVRGAALMLYRRELDRRDRAALAFFSATELPLFVGLALRKGRVEARAEGEPAPT
jgi:hypothetical protein